MKAISYYTESDWLSHAAAFCAHFPAWHVWQTLGSWTESKLKFCGLCACCWVEDVEEVTSLNHHYLIVSLVSEENCLSNVPTPLFLFLCVFQLSLGDEQCEVSRNGYESKELVYLVHIYCQVRQRTPLGLMLQSYRNTDAYLTSCSMHTFWFIVIICKLSHSISTANTHTLVKMYPCLKLFSKPARDDF